MAGEKNKYKKGLLGENKRKTTRLARKSSRYNIERSHFIEECFCTKKVQRSSNRKKTPNAKHGRNKISKEKKRIRICLQTDQTGRRTAKSLSIFTVTRREFTGYFRFFLGLHGLAEILLFFQEQIDKAIEFKHFAWLDDIKTVTKGNLEKHELEVTNENTRRSRLLVTPKRVLNS